MATRPCLVGNWKMNGLTGALAEADRIAAAAGRGPAAAVDIALCPPATLIAPMAARLAGTAVTVGGQDCHAAACGAFTGDVSAEMLADAGARLVVLGHSERRAVHAERDRDVRAKVVAAHRAGLVAVVCVGETAGQRAAGLTRTVVERQVTAALPDGADAAHTIVAYEPVWAIGSGLTPTADEIVATHAAIRAALVARHGAAGRAIRLLYGGSVKPANIAALTALPDVDGALVGGASLEAASFLTILDGIVRARAACAPGVSHPTAHPAGAP